MAIPDPARTEGDKKATEGQTHEEPEKALRPSTITIDGPAASGKSTIGELLARRLDYLYFDTGVMYRAVTWSALKRGRP
ncbi:MAG TPA: hypothetical protein ENI37_00605, partial [Chloroflexi bacterium]|nr:hypothetical protein [Chloroflexota bacterium]